MLEKCTRVVVLSNKRKAGKRLSVGEGVVAGSTLELRHTHSLLKDFMLQSYAWKARGGSIHIFTVTLIV